MKREEGDEQDLRVGLSIRKTDMGGHRAPASEDSIRPEAISVAGVPSGCLAAAL